MLKIGVFGFLLMVMMFFDVCMLVWCWIVLEMLRVIYSCGEIEMLVCLIWCDCGM